MLRLLTGGHHSQSNLLVFEELARESAANVQGFVAQLDSDVLRGAAHLLATAGRVRVHGVPQLHALRSFLTYGLGMIRQEVSLLNAPRLGVAAATSQLDRRDVVVAATALTQT
jgi:DNA-binding MurR/RpiR family transcriptional regulator